MICVARHKCKVVRHFSERKENVCAQVRVHLSWSQIRGITVRQRIVAEQLEVVHDYQTACVGWQRVELNSPVRVLSILVSRLQVCHCTFSVEWSFSRLVNSQ
uniref:Uncharacterized protein n=1 Tax=Cacopsylla melanoneura TaxID=428564 RepID=A0A8D9BD32_9HEMI